MTAKEIAKLAEANVKMLDNESLSHKWAEALEGHIKDYAKKALELAAERAEWELYVTNPDLIETFIDMRKHIDIKVQKQSILDVMEEIE